MKYSINWFCLFVCLGFFLAKNELYAQVSFTGIDIEEPQPIASTGVGLSVFLDKKDWTYRVGEKPVFTVNLFVDDRPLDGVDIFYTIGPEKMDPVKRGSVKVVDGIAHLPAATMSKPGFLRCSVIAKIEGKSYKAAATAAFEPENIKHTTGEPADFEKFWSNAIKDARGVPLNTKLTPIEKRSSDLVEVYQVEYEFFNNGIQKFYGVLSKPRKFSKYPAVIRFPGAGWAPLAGDQRTAQQGFITLDLYIHGHPVTENANYYEALKNNELKDYMYKGIADRDSFYYKNVILGCVRSIDLIYSLPDFNGRVGSWGSSQGGALSIITTSLEPRINNFVALCPAMCDFTGYLYDRAGGWPHLFAKPELYKDNKDQVMKTLSYYDVVNFAKWLEVPGFFSWGFNDPTTPPTSFYSAFNMVKSPKRLFIIPEGGHKIYPEQRKKTYHWLLQSLK